LGPFRLAVRSRPCRIPIRHRTRFTPAAPKGLPPQFGGTCLLALRRNDHYSNRTRNSVIPSHRSITGARVLTGVPVDSAIYGTCRSPTTDVYRQVWGWFRCAAGAAGAAG
jgi:hypothetical protein